MSHIHRAPIIHDILQSAHIPPQAIERFVQYDALLVDWNARMNLTAVTDPAEVARRHFLDCVQLPQGFHQNPGALIDVGSGAGFPGIPLLILHPEWDVTLLDASGKRCAFLQAVLDALGLQAQVVKARAEDFAHTHRATFDVATARAVAPLRVLAEYLLPLVKVEGVCWAYKGQAAAQELAEAAHALEVLGSDTQSIVPLLSTAPDSAPALVVLHKERETPARYPRKAGKPEKIPL